MTPRPSSKQGRLWLNRVSTELGEGQVDAYYFDSGCINSVRDTGLFFSRQASGVAKRRRNSRMSLE